MKNYLLIILSVILIMVIFNTCSDNGIGSNKTTSHNYIWTIDTIQPPPDVFQFIKEDIWGIDENNVWVVGHSDRVQYQIWRWDGVEWASEYQRFPGHRPSFRGIYGFSKDDIWIVGDENVLNYPDIFHRSFIAHYDGVQWHHFKDIKEAICANVWGYNSSELYVGCDSGLVLYYDGNTWEKQSTNTDAFINNIRGTSDGQLYAVGYELKSYFYGTYKYYFFRKTDKHWTIVDSFSQSFDIDDLFGSKLWISPDSRIYSSGKDGLFERKGNSFSHVLGENIFAIYGTADNNIFAGGRANTLYHYNGRDWYFYDQIINNDTHIYDIWANDENVFLMTSSPWLMYRGKLIQ